MSQVQLSPDNEKATFVCDNCEWEGSYDDLDMISDVEERINPGCIVPAGQCPECSALAYYRDEDAPSWTCQARLHQQNVEDKEDAERWRALLSTPLLQWQGSAGFDFKCDGEGKTINGNAVITPKGDGYMHFGMAFTSVNTYGDTTKPATEFSRNFLTAYADELRRLMRTNSSKDANT